MRYMIPILLFILGALLIFASTLAGEPSVTLDPGESVTINMPQGTVEDDWCLAYKDSTLVVTLSHVDDCP